MPSHTLKPKFFVMLMVLALLMASTSQNDVFAKTDNTKAAEKNQHNKTAKGGSTRQKKAFDSVPEKTKSGHKKGHKKQKTQLDVAKKAKKHQQSIVSIDNKKMVELNFGWPIKGRVLKAFSLSRNIKGIDITGKKGPPVKATERGKVVYGGQGLIGFGKLLIIRHNEVYLSAYANASRLLVKEGQHVEKGQVIAEMGDVGIKRTSLHFEIRKNGKPVNPLKLLPKK